VELYYQNPSKTQREKYFWQKKTKKNRKVNPRFYIFVANVFTTDSLTVPNCDIAQENVFFYSPPNGKKCRGKKSGLFLSLDLPLFLHKPKDKKKRKFISFFSHILGGEFFFFLNVPKTEKKKKKKECFSIFPAYFRR
jgi:hypothetical protein